MKPKISIDTVYNKSPAWFQNTLVSLYGINLYRRRYTGHFRSILELVESSHSWSLEKKHDYQMLHLQGILKSAREKIPYYKKLFYDFDIEPRHIHSLEDLRKIPTLKKETLRREPELFVQKDGPAPYSIQKTSGSSGTPVKIKTDEFTYKLAMALLLDLESRNGVNLRDKRATFGGRLVQPLDDMRPPYWRYNIAERQMLYSSYHLSPETFREYDRSLKSFSPKEIIGYPSAISTLANLYVESNSEPSYRPKLIITNSENLLPWQREIISTVFNCKIIDYYSTAEYLNFAEEIGDGRYQSNPLPGITELVQDDGSGVSGSLVMTTLTNPHMPLIRYEVGDRATIEDSKEMETGFPRLSSIDGRTDDVVITTNGRRIGRLSQVFKEVKGLSEAQIIQTKIGHAKILVVSDTDTRIDIQKLQENIASRLGTDFKYQIEITDRIPRNSNGKFRLVVQKIEA